LGRPVAGASRQFAAARDFDRSWGLSGPFADIAEPTGKQAQRLWLLRLHPIRRLEVFSGISDELRVGWMIDGFHASDDAHQLGIVVVNMLDNPVFALAGPEMRTAPVSAIDSATA
jgi:hypothetical protein